MRRVLPVLFLIVGACVAQPPERAPLPNVEDVLPEPVGCRLSVGEPQGVRVESVIAGGAAEGVLQEGDVISSVDGTPTETRPDLSTAMTQFSPGDTIDIAYRRDGVVGTAALTLGANPADETRPMIGVTVQTAFDQVPLEEANDDVEPSTTARPIQIGDSLYLFDPLVNTWEPTGIIPPEERRWVSTTSGIYSVTDTEPIQVVDLTTDEVIEDDGFEDWEVQRLIGSVGGNLLLVVTSEIPDQPGFVNLAVASFDPAAGETLWVSPVAGSFGIPVAAFGSPDASAFLSVGADPESGSQLGVLLFAADGTVQTTETLTENGEPMGWYDGTTMAFRSGEAEVTLFDFAEEEATGFELPSSLQGSVTASVGDGRHVIAVGGRDLLLQDLTDPNISSPLATNCAIGRTGDPGWRG